MANNSKEMSRGMMITIIVILALILLFMLFPGVREFFMKGKDDGSRSGDSAPVNVRVNGEPVRSTGTSRSTTSDTTRGTDSDSAVNVDVNETEDGTSINIEIPEEVNVNAEGTPSASVGPLPNL